MNQETYKLEVDRESKVYAFDSEGPKGVIAKRIQFSYIGERASDDSELEGLYNIAFGDYNPLTDVLDDKVNSNNGDKNVVLASVAAAARDFLDKNPNCTLYATGSTPERTRLYQMGINRFYDEIITDYVIWGLTESKDWKLFERNTNYHAFVMRKR